MSTIYAIIYQIYAIIYQIDVSLIVDYFLVSTISSFLISCFLISRSWFYHYPFPWNIVSTSEPEHSFRDFFYESIQPHIPSTSELSYDLVHAAVGANKEKMDKVDLVLVSWTGFCLTKGHSV